ncbi:hypothetical protein PHYBOEH_003396 [Phytophthora boehmeriae]|uniref:RxLR effector protein n=1 Tax=Phytophthora boehmeriae TaxID=109152 RepID=A0A8T1WUZ9_9STRA|nr:hypothetical protein PHYBOEH_003396 [Phytophthora boehmeriae]
MRLSCILLVASVALFTAGNALPASTNPDQIAVAKVDVPNDNRFLRSVDTDADEDDSVDVQDDADEDDSSEDQDEERMFNAISVMMGLKTADDVAAEVAKAAVKVSNNEFLQNLLKVDFRKKTFTRWKDTEHMFPEQAKRFMEMFTTEKRFMNIVTQYEDFFNGVLKLDDIV